jgi:type IX secretion system PorP/SprF family membrane protein
VLISTLFITGYLLTSINANAQLTGFHAVYFQNEYLANPAMAGMEKGLDVNLGYQKQWATVPGGPKVQNLTLDYNSGNRVGLGFTVNGDQSGLIGTTRIMATYAYHLPLSTNGNKLNFGLSLGINDTYIDYSRIVGDAGDDEAQNVNSRATYIDGDFGLSYTSKSLTIQGAIPNLKSVFFKSEDENLDVDRATFYTAVSYKIFFETPDASFNIQPKFAFRGVKGFDNIADMGVNFDLTSYNFSLSGIYHTNQSVTFGLGLDLQNTVLIFAYTNNTGPLSVYANNTFELGVKLRFFR